MSIPLYGFAECRIGGAWTLVGEPVFSKRWGCLRPPIALEIAPRNELITVLCGQLTSAWGLDHTGLETIADSRGLPEDLSPVLRHWAEMQIREGLAHHPSWLLVREILDFDWHTPKILHRGYVMASMAQHFDPEHPECPFPEDVWPGGCYEVATNPEALESCLQASGSSEERFIYSWPRPGTVEVYWTESHYRALGEPDEFLAELRELGPPDDVRLVFWIVA